MIAGGLIVGDSLNYISIVNGARGSGDMVQVFKITVCSLTAASQVVSSMMSHGVQCFVYFLPGPAHLEDVHAGHGRR